ncbi:MAG: sulfatase [bacterium]
MKPMNRAVKKTIIVGGFFLVFIILLLNFLYITRLKKPSIILILVDTLRPDHLGCYGYSKNVSPNIDKFSADALLFKNCFSQASDTRLSCASILSGFFPHETKITESFVLPPDVTTLPEILQQQGYTTAAVVSNYILRKNKGWDQGFMIYDDTMDQCELVRKCPERIAEYTTKKAIELIKEFHKDPLFLWVHYQDPHGPYTPPEPYNRMFGDPNQKCLNLKINYSVSGRGGIPTYQVLNEQRNFYHYVSQYDGEIRYLDEHFGYLIEALKEYGIYNNALIIFSSDHGEGMGEHNYYFAHGEEIYNSQIHVPCIVRYGRRLKGIRTNFVQHIDIVPTIINILALKKNPLFRGRDFRKAHAAGGEIFSETNSPFVWDSIKLSLIVDGLKLIYTPLFNQYQLFDLIEDPSEKNNLSGMSHYKKQEDNLKIRLERVCKEDFLQIPETIKPPDMTEEEKARLKSLGYLQ